MPRVTRLRAGGATGRAALAADHAVPGPAETDAPAVLAHLELTKSRGTELRDQRREQHARESIDRRVVGRMAALSGIFDRTRSGHSLDLLVGRRLVA